MCCWYPFAVDLKHLSFTVTRRLWIGAISTQALARATVRRSATRRHNRASSWCFMSPANSERCHLWRTTILILPRIFRIQSLHLNHSSYQWIWLCHWKWYLESRIVAACFACVQGIVCYSGAIHLYRKSYSGSQFSPRKERANRKFGLSIPVCSMVKMMFIFNGLLGSKRTAIVKLLVIGMQYLKVRA